MFLVDKPYVSEFLANSLEKNQREVIATAEAKLLLKGKNINWLNETDAQNKILAHGAKIYSNSENCIAWLANHLGEHPLNQQINFLKDKIKFRELLAENFPDFLFKKLSLEELQNLRAENLQFPLVLKPSVGFFSIGVHIIEDEQALAKAKKLLTPQELGNDYPQEVVDTSSFILEEFIEGAEYAIDSYTNNEGEVVILSILEHQFKSSTDTSDRIYSTSLQLINKYEEKIKVFLTTISNKLAFKNFPFHTEIRITKNGEIKPIEINPLRFGGWCTTADLNWYAYGINSYEYFFNQQQVDWNKTLEKGRDKKYSLVILDNVTELKNEAILRFDYTQLKKDYPSILELRELDIQTYPVFGFMFIETPHNDYTILNELLHTDFKKYIRVR